MITCFLFHGWDASFMHGEQPPKANQVQVQPFLNGRPFKSHRAFISTRNALQAPDKHTGVYQVRYHVNKYYRIYIFTGYRSSYANVLIFSPDVYIYLLYVCIQSGQVVAHTTFLYMHVHNKKNRIMDISRNEAVHSLYIILRIYIASEEQYWLC